MAYYKICPFCGAHLDSCERCDCQDEARKSENYEHTKSRDAPAFGLNIRAQEVKNSA